MGVIKINPAVMDDKRDAFAVAVNEALRLWMEDHEFAPGAGVTDEQRAFFKDTAYADDEDAMAKTVLARLATRDTSVRGSPEQIEDARRLLDAILEPMGEQDPDFTLVVKMREALISGGAEPQSPPQPPTDEGSTQSATGGGRVIKATVRAKPGQTMQFAKDRAVDYARKVVEQEQRIVDENTPWYSRSTKLQLDLKVIGPREDVFKEGKLVGTKHDVDVVRIAADNRKETTRDAIDNKVASTKASADAAIKEVASRATEAGAALKELPGLVADTAQIVGKGLDDNYNVNNLDPNIALVEGAKVMNRRLVDIYGEEGKDMAVNYAKRHSEEGEAEAKGLEAQGVEVDVKYAKTPEEKREALRGYIEAGLFD